MGRGFWLNPKTSKCVQVATTHDKWVRDDKNAESIGLPAHAYDEIVQYPPTAIDEIRLVAVNWGLVRIREHPRYTSVQFSARPHRVTPVLQAVVKALRQLRVYSDTLKIDNLLFSDSASLSLVDLEDHLEKDMPVFGEQSDVPMFGCRIQA